MGVSIEKLFSRQAVRTAMRSKRCALTTQEQTTAALRIVRRVMNHPRIQIAHTLAIFLSFDGEINTRLLIDTLWRVKKTIYLPVLHPFSPGYLLFFRYTATTPLVVNRFNILEPRSNITTLISLSDLDILFTPLVAFDKQGHRLGMGGGFYDRILKDWRLESNCYPIGLAHDCQRIIGRLPVEVWDVTLPEIITPSRNWKFSL